VLALTASRSTPTHHALEQTDWREPPAIDEPLVAVGRRIDERRVAGQDIGLRVCRRRSEAEAVTTEAGREEEGLADCRLRKSLERCRA